MQNSKPILAMAVASVFSMSVFNGCIFFVGLPGTVDDSKTWVNEWIPAMYQITQHPYFVMGFFLVTSIGLVVALYPDILTKIKRIFFQGPNHEPPARILGSGNATFAGIDNVTPVDPFGSHGSFNQWSRSFKFESENALKKASKIATDLGCQLLHDEHQSSLQITGSQEQCIQVPKEWRINEIQFSQDSSEFDAEEWLAKQWNAQRKEIAHISDDLKTLDAGIQRVKQDEWKDKKIIGGRNAYQLATTWSDTMQRLYKRLDGLL